jgi:hypothetical protein
MSVGYGHHFVQEFFNSILPFCTAAISRVAGKSCYFGSKDVRRTLASSLLSLLLLTTLVWGGCISCEQFFMWPGVKGCCGANGQCKTKKSRPPQTGRDCKQIAFEHQKSVDLHMDLPVLAVTPSDFLPRLAEPLTGWFGVSPMGPSPPDRQALHSTFLI